jgi:peptidoglycan/xylan/chitin deacetylase (PgdA/CDA1 family)
MSRFRILVLFASVLLSGCLTATVEPSTALAQTCRFLLTFDDGPSARSDFNTTLEILRQLENNDVQPGIKALFFVQTRNPTGGGTELGRSILRYKHSTGHVLGLHSGTEHGHIRHTKMPPEVLAASLRNGQDDLRAITGGDTVFIRPTFWGYNEQTHDLYTAHGLKMLLTDVNSRDGIRFHNLFGMRNRIRTALSRARHEIEHGRLPEYRGAIPIVITFHDLNTITARSISEYLRLLVEEAAVTGLPLTDKPFYDSADDILAAAARRATPPKSVTRVAQQSPGARGSPAPGAQVATALP